jgi:hypothetical protein
MKCYRAMFTFVITLMVANSASASDFSGLADPGFARMSMLSPQRFLEVKCVAGANGALADTVGTKPLTQAEAARLTKAVSERLATNLGSEKAAKDNLDMHAIWSSPEWAYDNEKLDRIRADRSEQSAQCTQIYAATRSDTLAAILEAPSDKPITLPDLDTCLAYDLLARPLPDYKDYGFVSERNNEVYEQLMEPKGPARTAHEAVIAKRAEELKDTAPQIILVRAGITCLATYMDVIRPDERPMYDAADMGPIAVEKPSVTSDEKIAPDQTSP